MFYLQNVGKRVHMTCVCVLNRSCQHAIVRTKARHLYFAEGGVDLRAVTQWVLLLALFDSTHIVNSLFLTL